MKGAFVWIPEAENIFNLIMTWMMSAPILALHAIDKVFEVDWDAFHIGIWAVIIQEGHTITFFSEKLNASRLNYPIYDI